MCLLKYALIEGLQVDTDADTPIFLGHHDHSCAPVSCAIYLEDDSRSLHAVELITDFLSVGNRHVPGCKESIGELH